MVRKLHVPLRMSIHLIPGCHGLIKVDDTVSEANRSGGGCPRTAQAVLAGRLTASRNDG
jgi:hypothetical protein